MSYLDVTDDEVGDLFQIMYILAAREGGKIKLTEKELKDVPQPKDISIVRHYVEDYHFGEVELSVRDNRKAKQ